jgi:hypothetical protein
VVIDNPMAHMTEKDPCLMIDPSGILGVLYSLSKEWREPSIAIMSPISKVEDEPAYKKTVAEGCELCWVRLGKIRERHRNGWKPLTERDKLGRPTIFMDRNKEQVLMLRPRGNQH